MDNNTKKFNVTFTENTKYNPFTRTVTVEAMDEFHARRLIASQFDSFKFDKTLRIKVPTGKKITIDKVKEVKKDKEEIVNG